MTDYACTASYPSGLDCHAEHDEACEPTWGDWCAGCQANYDPPGSGADPWGRTVADMATSAE